MNKATGETVWTTDRSIDFEDLDPETGLPAADGDYRKAFSTPIIARAGDKPVLVSLASKALYCYEPETGKELWRVENLKSHSGSSRPLTGHGLVYSTMGTGRELLAVRPDGRGVVTDTHVAWRYDRAVPHRSSPVLVDDLIYMVDDRGVAACVEAATGQEVWTTRLGSDYSASPLAADGRIYFFDQEGRTTVIEPGRELKVLAENQLDDGFMASAAVSGRALYLRTRSALYRIEK
jgi:outer membrane protein assembly factor BamB